MAFSFDLSGCFLKIRFRLNIRDCSELKQGNIMSVSPVIIISHVNFDHLLKRYMPDFPVVKVPFPFCN
jgi:hypothetical protein